MNTTIDKKKAKQQPRIYTGKHAEERNKNMARGREQKSRVIIKHLTVIETSFGRGG